VVGTREDPLGAVGDEVHEGVEFFFFCSEDYQVWVRLQGASQGSDTGFEFYLLIGATTSQGGRIDFPSCKRTDKRARESGRKSRRVAAC